MFFRSKYRAVAEQLSVELAEARSELTAETHRRVSAESVAEDRAQQIDYMRELLAEANASRDAAIAERLKSLDLVNTALLAQHGPEKPGPDPKQFTELYKKGLGHRKSTPVQRGVDTAFFKFIEEKRAKAKPEQTEELPPAASVQ